MQKNGYFEYTIMKIVFSKKFKDFSFYKKKKKKKNKSQIFLIKKKKKKKFSKKKKKNILRRSQIKSLIKLYVRILYLHCLHDKGFQHLSEF